MWAVYIWHPESLGMNMNGSDAWVDGSVRQRSSRIAGGRQMHQHEYSAAATSRIPIRKPPVVILE
jgi:hypothetical protein